MTGEKKSQKVDLTSDKAKKELSSKAAAENAKAAPDQRGEAMKSLKEAAQKQISNSQTKLAAGGKPITKETQAHLENYFKGEIDRFDADKDGKISKPEAEKFQKQMLAESQKRIDQLSSAADKNEKMNAAASQAEKFSEEKMKTAEAGVDSIKDAGDLSDLEGANKEMTQLQTQNGAFQQNIQQQMSSIQAFGAEFAKFQTAEEGYGHIKAVVNAVINSSERDAKIAAMKLRLVNQKTAANATLKNLRDKKKTLDSNGEKIKAAIAKARASAIKERDDKVAEIKTASEGQKEKIAERKKEYDRLQKAKVNMQQRQKGIQARQGKVAGLRRKWDEKQGKTKLNAQEKAYKDGGVDIDAEIQGYELILAHPGVSSEHKKKVKKVLESAQERKSKGAVGLTVIKAMRESGEGYEQQLDDKQKKANSELQTVNGHLQRQEETSAGLSSNIATLEGLQLEYATSAKQAETIYNKRIDAIDTHSEGVNTFLLDSAMGRDQSIDGLQQSVNSLNAMNVTSKGLGELLNPLNIVGDLSKGIGGSLASVSHWIDGGVRDVLNMTRDGDSFWDKAIYGGTQFLSIFTGFVSGGVELIGGLFTLTGGLVTDIGSIPDALVSWDSSKLHALDTIKGLGAIIGYDGVKGEFSFDKLGDTWFTMLKSLVGYGTNWGYTKDASGKEVWRDEYGSGFGKGVFNVVSMLVGAGEVKAAATVAKAGAKVGALEGAKLAAQTARIAAIEAAKVAGKTVGRFTGRGAQTLAFSKAFLKNLKPQSLTKAANEARLAEGVGGKSLAYTKSLGSSAKGAAQRGWQGAKEGVKNGFTAKAMKVGDKTVSRTPVGHALRQVPRVAAKATAEIAMLPYKLVWKGGKALRNTGRAFSNVRRGVFNRRAVRAADAGEKMGKAANTIEAHSAGYAEARVHINEIIQSKPTLRARAAEIEKMGAGKVAARRALEAEVAQQLVKTEPALAEAFIKTRQAANTLQSEAAGYVKATRNSIEKITKNRTARADFVEYNTLRRDLVRAKNNPAAANNIRKRIKEFEADPARVARVQQYEGAIAAKKALRDHTKQLDELHEGLGGSQSAEAAKLADEIAEARRGTAPADSSMADISTTRAPGFADDFIEQYTKTTTEAARNTLTESYLGTVHSGGPLERVLEGIKLRKKYKVRTQPAIPNSFKVESRQKLLDALEDSIRSGDDALYQSLKNKAGDASKEYIVWMEEQYVARTAKEARSIILADSKGFAEALQANQATSINTFEGFAKIIEEGVSQKRLQEFMNKPGVNLPSTWREALEQMRQRKSFMNKQAEITGNIALTRIRAEYATVIGPELSSARAAAKLQRRYRNDSMGLTAKSGSEGGLIAREVKLTDGTYSLRVAEDGSVRLFNKSGDMIMTAAESRAVRGNLGIGAEMTGKEVADAIANRYKRQGAKVGEGESRLVSKELLLDGEAHSLKLAPDGELHLLDSQGKRVMPTKAAAPVKAPATSTAPAPVTGPAPAAVPVKSSPMRRFDMDDAIVREAIEVDAALYAKYNSADDLGKQVIRTKAEVQLYDNSFPSKMTGKRLKELEANLHAAKGGEVAVAERALADFKLQPNYIRHAEYQKMKSLIEEAQIHINKTPPRVKVAQRKLAEAKLIKVKNSTIPKLNGSQLAVEEAAEILARESVPVKASRKFKQTIQRGNDALGSITLKGKKYTIKMSEEGRFQLIDDAQRVVSPNKAAAQVRVPKTLAQRNAMRPLERTIDTLQENLVATESKIARAKALVERAKASNKASSLKRAESALDDLTAQRKTIKTEITAREAELVGETKRIALNESVAALEEKIASRHGTVAKLEAEIKAGQTAVDDVARIEQNIQQAKTSSARLEADLQAAKSDLVAARPTAPKAARGMSQKAQIGDEAPIFRNEQPRPMKDVHREYEVASIGDLHGNIYAMEGNCKSLNIVNAGADFRNLNTIRWTGGNRRVVFHGDMLADRIASGTDCILAMRKLRRQARQQGGDVIYIGGNHEEFARAYLTNSNSVGGKSASYAIKNYSRGTVEFARKYGDEGMRNNPNLKITDVMSAEARSTVLKNMRAHPEGKLILEEMCEMRVVEYIDDTLFTHANPSAEMMKLLDEPGLSVGKRVDKLNKAYQEGLRHELLGPPNPSPRNPQLYSQIRDSFMDTELRGANLQDVNMQALNKKGVNRVVHGHDDLSGNAQPVQVRGGVEVHSVDYSSAKPDHSASVDPIRPAAGEKASSAIIDRSGNYRPNQAPAFSGTLPATPAELAAKQARVAALEQQIAANKAGIAQYGDELNAAKAGQSPSRTAQINQELATARAEATTLNTQLATANANLAKLPPSTAIAPATAGAVPAAGAAPKAATAGAPATAAGTPTRQSAQALRGRRENAVKDYRAAREQVVALEDRIVPLKERLAALEAGPATPRSQVQKTSIQNNIDELTGKMKKSTALADKAADLIKTTRREYWSSRLRESGQAISEKIGIQRKVKWITDSSKFVGKAVKLGGTAVAAPARYLWAALKKQEQITASAAPKLVLFGRAGAEINNRMMALRGAAVAGSPVTSNLLHHLAMDQYDILKETEGPDGETLGLPSREKFASMSSEDQTKTLGSGYAQLEGVETGNQERFYTSIERDYNAAKGEKLQTALAKADEQGAQSVDDVTKALNEEFGTQGLNDSQRGYEVTMEGITMKVDAEGNRTYEGVDKWVAAAPTRKTTRGVFAAKTTEYQGMTPGALKEEAGDKQVNSAESFQEHAADSIQRSLVAQFNKTKTHATAGSFDSTEKTKSGAPQYTVKIDDEGKMEVKVNKVWAAEAYNRIKSKPEPEKPKPRPQRVASRTQPPKEQEPEADPEPSPDDNPIV